MNQTPCEYIVWNGLPIIRRGIVKVMISKHGLSQKEAAEKLGISTAAVSQYLSGKRGREDITDRDTLNEVNISAERIITFGNGVVASEICRLCKIFISKKIFYFKNDELNCKIIQKRY